MLTSLDKPRLFVFSVKPGPSAARDGFRKSSTHPTRVVPLEWSHDRCRVAACFPVSDLYFQEAMASVPVDCDRIMAACGG
jgi:hypothetical protein